MWLTIEIIDHRRFSIIIVGDIAKYRLIYANNRLRVQLLKSIVEAWQFLTDGQQVRLR